jgi:hypothetical protein
MLPEGCFGPFDAGGQKALERLHSIGVRHIAKFMGEPRTQAEWDAWGF